MTDFMDNNRNINRRSYR